MDWAEALAYMPHCLAVADKKGRVLLLSGEIPGVRVGRSILKLAAQDEVVPLGRAAKAALREAEPVTVDEVTARNGKVLRVQFIPFARGTGAVDHLLVLVDQPTPEPRLSLAEEVARERAAVPRYVTPAPPMRSGEAPSELSAEADTPETTLQRVFAPMAPAKELVIVAAGGTIPLARAAAATISTRLKARAWPVARLVETLRSRGGQAVPAEIDRALDPGTRLMFLGRSSFTESVRGSGGKLVESELVAWACGGQRVRCAAVWSPTLPNEGMSERLGDLQFEIMEICRRAMPIGRRPVQVDPSLKLAATFLEDPACGEGEGRLRDQVRHQQLVLGIARFMQDGLEMLISTSNLDT